MGRPLRRGAGAGAAAVEAARRPREEPYLSIANRREASAPAVIVTWRPAYVALGSNLCDPVARVLEAFDRLAALNDCRLELRSRLYRSRPLGPQDQPDFVNAAAGLLTTLAARALLDALLGVELSMGRRRGERWGPRVIDLDLIWMVGPPIDEPGLRLPHSAMSARAFVLHPLADIAPTLAIPGLGLVSDLKNGVPDTGLSVIDQAR